MNVRNSQQIVLCLVMFLFSFLVLVGCSNSSSNNTSPNTTSSYLIGGAKQGKTLSLIGTILELAGRSQYMPDGTGSAAQFSSPSAITTDGANLYVADYSTIRKVVVITGEVTTLAGSAEAWGLTDGTGSAAQFSSPSGITTDGTNLYVTDGSTIRKVVISTGEVTTIAGRVGTYGTTDGTGSAASFNSPNGITTDGTNLYVPDSGTIRKVVIATGKVTTLAGRAMSGGYIDGTGSAARFFNPSGITTDGISLYVADSSTIRKVEIATGEVTTMAGSAGVNGSTDGTGSAARFSGLAGITTDRTSLFVVDTTNGTIRKVVIATGEVTTLAGSAGSYGSTDGTGTAAQFFNPSGITTDGTNLYVADTSNGTIRMAMIATGEVTTLAGGGVSSGSTDGTGADALFNHPNGITTDGTNLYVTSTGTIRKVVIATGEVTTLLGRAVANGSTGGAGSSRFSDLAGITTDGTNLYVVDTFYNTILRVTIATGEVTTLAGSAGPLRIDYSTGAGTYTGGSTDGTGSAARFKSPKDVTTDGTNLYVVDTYNRTIRKVVIATGEVTTLAGSAGAWGSTDGTGSAARFTDLTGITTDGTNLYVADTFNNTIRKIEIATGNVTTLAGSPGQYGSADGTGSAARFSYPRGISTDGTNLYVADSNNNTIRKVVIASGEVTTLAGGIGSSPATSLYFPTGITTDGIRLYVTNTDANTLISIE